MRAAASACMNRASYGEPRRRVRALVLCVLLLALCIVGRAEIIDRVLAILPGQIITQSDVQAAVDLGFVEVPADGDRIAATEFIPEIARNFHLRTHRHLHLGLVTCRTFETPAASTIPLFAQDVEYVKAIYGDRATALVLREGEGASAQILDVLRRPLEYAEIVRDIRRHLAENHSYAVRLQELVRIVAE